MKNLLLLHERHSADDADIKKVAFRRGWKTERTNMYKVKEHMEGSDFIRYYGNTLHAKLIEPHLPFIFSPIDYSLLARLPMYTNRMIAYITIAELNKIGIHTDVFIKPARDKWFEAKVYHAGNTISGEPLDGDEIYISEVLKFEDEVRCFCLDGEILTSSYYRINQQVWDRVSEDPEHINFDERLKDTPLPRMVKEIYAKGGLPRGVVIDFGTTKPRAFSQDLEWSLVEFNEAWACGLYYTQYDKAFDCIIASQENK